MKRCAHGGPPHGERGGATVLALAATGVVLGLMVGGLVLASTVVAAHQATTAADLSSLGGAAAWGEGASSATVCERAGAVARRNGARLDQCTVTAGGAVTVTTAVRVGLSLTGPGRDVVRARARAGPEPGG